MYDFSERKVLITGSSRGIGKKIAEDFISLGAEVLITGTNESLLSTVKKELGPKCLMAHGCVRWGPPGFAGRNSHLSTEVTLNFRTTGLVVPWVVPWVPLGLEIPARIPNPLPCGV